MGLGVERGFGEVVTVDRGTTNASLTLVNKEATRAYDDWSFSSSSENGLKEVKLATSSSLLLLRDLEEDECCPLGCAGIGMG